MATADAARSMFCRQTRRGAARRPCRRRGGPAWRRRGSVRPSFSVSDAELYRSCASARAMNTGESNSAGAPASFCRYPDHARRSSSSRCRCIRASTSFVSTASGVGSHAAAALARSGVGASQLVDFGQVSLSSLNRHAVATLQDVGSPKVAVLRRRRLRAHALGALRLVRREARRPQRLRSCTRVVLVCSHDAFPTGDAT